MLRQQQRYLAWKTGFGCTRAQPDIQHCRSHGTVRRSQRMGLRREADVTHSKNALACCNGASSWFLPHSAYRPFCKHPTLASVEARGRGAFTGSGGSGVPSSGGTGGCRASWGSASALAGCEATDDTGFDGLAMPLYLACVRRTGTGSD